MSDGRWEGQVQAAGRLDIAMVAEWPDLSRARAAALVDGGHVTVDGVVAVRPAQKVKEGQALVVDPPAPAPAEAVAQEIPLQIVYEDADVVVVDKAPGMVVHPGAGHADGTLVNALLHHVGDLSGIGGVERPGIVHRLDRGTSGLLVVAKHDVAHRALAAQFAEHSAGRRYLAVAHGAPADLQGTVRSQLGRHPTDRVRFCSVEAPAGRAAVTHWRRLAVGRGLSLIGCTLETGRTHQIRVHLSEQGWPLVGDPLYGRPQVASWLRPLVPDGRVMLHAWQLRFRHPSDGRLVRLTAPIPDDLADLMAAAGLKAPNA